MAKLNIADEPTVAAIYAAIKAANKSSHRSYLGASFIGRPCARELWLMFRWVKRPQFDGRMLRLFNTGHLEEPRLIADLQSAGVEVLEVDPTTGEQWAISYHGGHFRGHADGAGLGIHAAPKTWHLLEFKTHNSKSFAKLQADGVEKTKPEHVAQMQVYMHGLGLTRAYYLARNKDTDELYGERLRYDKKQAEYWIERAGQIIFANEPPLPIGKEASFFQCKFCDFTDYCYRTVSDLPEIMPERNCRTCIHSTPKETGGWLCEQKGYEVDQDQGMVCKNHRFIPMLFPSLEFTHADENLNVFYRSNTQKYINTEKRNTAMFQLRPYQERAISELYAWMNRHIQDNKNPIVNMCVGAGKSVVIAELCKRAISEFPQTRIIMTVASRELCQQNLEKLLAIWPEAPAGVCSAALGKKDLESQIIFATIGSIAKKAIHLGRVDMIIVDECHNINTEQSGMYRKFISDCEKWNGGKILVIGFTGTPFRGNGVHLHDPGNEKRLFDSIATTVGMDELLKSGHLSPLVVQDDTPTLVDTSSAKVVGGDYVISDLDNLMNDEFVIDQATTDIIQKGATRKKWLVFCVTVEHAENVLASFIKKGINANMITAKTPKAERQAIINQYKTGDLQCLVNIATLTTGFDAPETDLIALLRPTKSPVLYVQIAGRGMRIAPGKTDCLWLDYTDTTVEQGPVNKITGRKGFKSKPSEAPMRECPECQNYMPISFKECSECGYIFPIEEKPKHDTRSGTADILTGFKPPVKEWFDVSNVSYAKHTKRETGTNSLRVSYHIGDIGPVISEWIPFESQSQFARKQANAWWLKRYIPAVDFNCIPETVADAINASELLMTPKRILAQKEGKYWKVINYEFCDA